jgi:hypothetical protein
MSGRLGRIRGRRNRTRGWSRDLETGSFCEGNFDLLLHFYERSHKFHLTTLYTGRFRCREPSMRHELTIDILYLQYDL